MTVFINKKEEYSCAQVTDIEGERSRRGLTVDQFYAVPRDPPSSSALPIFDESHVKNAMARFNQTHMTPEEKRVAYNKIVRAASKHGINQQAFKTTNELSSDSDEESGIYDHREKVEMFDF
ncbi:MAG: DUF6582 domain-containing protein [Candidatus Nanoarchaeia archaeon]|jgi:hypothetical protein